MSWLGSKASRPLLVSLILPGCSKCYKANFWPWTKLSYDYCTTALNLWKDGNYLWRKIDVKIKKENKVRISNITLYVQIHLGDKKVTFLTQFPNEQCLQIGAQHLYLLCALIHVSKSKADYSDRVTLVTLDAFNSGMSWEIPLTCKGATLWSTHKLTSVSLARTKEITCFVQYNLLLWSKRPCWGIMGYQIGKLHAYPLLRTIQD